MTTRRSFLKGIAALGGLALAGPLCWLEEKPGLVVAPGPMTDASWLTSGYPPVFVMNSKTWAAIEVHPVLAPMLAESWPESSTGQAIQWDTHVQDVSERFALLIAEATDASAASLGLWERPGFAPNQIIGLPAHMRLTPLAAG